MAMGCDLALVTSCCHLIDALLGSLPSAPDAAALERFVLYAMIWSIGGVLEQADRAKLDQHLRSMAPSSALPTPDTVFEYHVDTTKADYPWCAWLASVPAAELPCSPAVLRRRFASLLVPTVDCVRCEFNVERSVEMQRAVLL
eukprot:6623977-Prymnesium_polylepis.1